MKTRPTDSVPIDYTTYAFARSLAVSSGDMSIVIRHEVQRVLKENRNDIAKSLDYGLQQLSVNKFISPRELAQLKVICRHLLGSVRGKENGEDAYFEISKVYDALLFDGGSSPVALAVASVATSAFDFEKSNSVSFTPMSTAAGAVAGATIGASFGGAMGGPLGAAIGAAIGGAAGAAIGWCNEHGK